MTETRLDQLKRTLGELGLAESTEDTEGYRVERFAGKLQLTVLLDLRSSDEKAEAFRKAVAVDELEEQLKDLEYEQSRSFSVTDPLESLLQQSCSLLRWSVVGSSKATSSSPLSQLAALRSESKSTLKLLNNFHGFSQLRLRVRDSAQLRYERARSDTTRSEITEYLKREAKVFKLLELLVNHATPISCSIQSHYAFTVNGFRTTDDDSRERKYRELEGLRLALISVFLRPSTASNQNYLDQAKRFYENPEVAAFLDRELDAARASSAYAADHIKGSWTSYKAAGDDLLDDIEMAMLIDEI